MTPRPFSIRPANIRPARRGPLQVPHRPIRQNIAQRAKAAIHRQDIDTLEALFDEGYHVDMRLDGSKRGVVFAVTQEDPTVFDFLVARGAGMNHRGKPESNPLFYTVLKGDLRGVRRAIAAGARVEETRDYTSKHPPEHLFFRIGETDKDIVRTLLDAGGWKALADVNAQGQTPAESLEKQGEGQSPDLFYSHRQELAALLRRYEDMPTLDRESVDFDKAALFAPQAQGLCPLDHPLTWEEWDDVLSTLAQKGEKVTLADLRQKDVSGRSWLQRAAECGAIEAVLRGLNAQGESLGSDELMEHGRPNALYHALRDNQQLSPVFSLNNNGVHLTQDDLSALIKPLSREEREKTVPHFAQLRLQLAKNSNPLGRGR